MKRLYFAFLPLTYKREGGVWWFKDLTARELQPTIDAMEPVCTALRVSDQFPAHTLRDIKPPADALVIK